jgi:hypothetical protein
MFSKTNLISAIVTALWGFFGGYLLWGILTASFLNSHVGSAIGAGKETPDFLHLAIGCLISGLVFSLFYSNYAKGEHSISKGINFGILMGIYMGVGHGLINYATTNILDFTGTLANMAIYIVFLAIMGMLASMVYSKVTD